MREGMEDGALVMGMLSTTDLFAGRYRLGPLVGQGGMSDVFSATDQDTGREVAVKVVRSLDPELARRLAQEARVHQGMAHPGLIELLHSGMADGSPYLVMEYVQGTTLAAALHHEPLSPRLTAKLGTMVAGALDYLHERGIVHRDVKPSNILLAADGRALLGDFGIARLLDSTAFTVPGTLLGTVAYMAPEQLEDHQVGPAADMWSLGIVLLECLTGRRVYEGMSSEVVARRLSGPVPVPGDLPAPWRVLLTGMFAHEPEQRLTGAQVASLLEAGAFATPWSLSAGTDTAVTAAAIPVDPTALVPVADPGTAPSSEPEPQAARRRAPTTGRRRRRRWLLVGAAAALVLIGGAVAYGMDARPSTDATANEVLPPVSTTDPSTTSTTSTTTTVVVTPASTLATLEGDVTSGMDDGTVPPGLGHSITDGAQQAVSAEAAGWPQQAANDLEQVAATIASNGPDGSGSLSGGESSTLQADLSALADALGLGAAGEAPTTTPTSVANGGPNVGHRHGHHGNYG
jgi:hypothetical protein